MRHRHLSPLEALRQPGWDHWIADALGLTDHTPKLTRTLLARSLLVASALHVALSAIARRVADAGRELLRQAIHACLPNDTCALEIRLAAALRRTLPRNFRKKSIPIAIDIHRRPFYGDRRHAPGITGGKAEAGSGWFWSYATAVSLLPGQRHTLALTAVQPGDKMASVVERLLAQVLWSGVRVRYVLLDRSFYAAGVVNALARRKLRFIIPMVRRGQEAQRFFGRRRGWFDHTFCSRRREDACVRVAVVNGPDGNSPLVFACSAGFDSLPGVVLRYGRRFGIESSYRQLGECLATTSSRDVVYRLLLVCVSVLIRQWWVMQVNESLGLIRAHLILLFLTPPDTQPAHTTQSQTTQTDTTT